MNKKIISALLCGAMVLGCAAPVMAADKLGTDRKSHWLEDQQVTHSSKSLQKHSKKQQKLKVQL